MSNTTYSIFGSISLVIFNIGTVRFSGFNPFLGYFTLTKTGLPVSRSCMTKAVSTSNQREKIIATENTEITEDFFSVSSVLSVADKYKQ